jgi:ABC-type dipeptide/oligopeptide/nickel transport system permease subunit
MKIFLALLLLALALLGGAINLAIDVYSPEYLSEAVAAAVNGGDAEIQALRIKRELLQTAQLVVQLTSIVLVLAAVYWVWRERRARILAKSQRAHDQVSNFEREYGELRDKYLKTDKPRPGILRD